MSVSTPAAAIETFLAGVAIAILLYPILQWRLRQLNRSIK